MHEILSKRLGVSLGITLVLAGCQVGPNYLRPVVAIDAAFVQPGSAPVDSPPPAADIAGFWRGFNDPALNDLVEHALAANGDVRIARARLHEALSIQIGAGAALWPEVDTSAGVVRDLQPAYLFPGTTRGQRTGDVFDAGLSAGWDIDLFGRNARVNQAALAQVEASQAGVHAARVAVVAEIARRYLELRGLQQRYEVATRSLANQRQTWALTGVRLDAGRGSRLDVVRARSLVDGTEAVLPMLQAAIERDAFRLATLTAQSPRAVVTALATARPMPELPVSDLARLAVGTPEQLLRRRPDLVMAERQLAAATANIGVATADLFPRVSLTGLIGFATPSLAQLGASGSQQYALGAALTWPLLDLGRVRSRIGASQARTEQALASYEQSVATALEETEVALSQFTRAAQQAGHLQDFAANADEAARLSRRRFQAGSIDLLVVLDAERQALASRDALVQARLGQATALVDVYRALGGGWE